MPPLGHKIGVDLGGTKIEGVVLDASHRIVTRKRVATERDRGYDFIVERVGALVDELLLSAPDCELIGIGTPGSVTRRGTMKNSNTTCLNGRALPDDLERRIGRSIRLENDANCFALAEATAGAAQGAELVFGVILGTGVGGGLVHRGELWRGRQHLAGEWGHHCIDPSGPLCYCGQRGCVETFLSGPSLAAQYHAITGNERSSEQVIAAARTGEEHATAVFGKFLDYFGRAIANLVDILDPDMIVLGGGLSNVEELYEEGRAKAEGYVFNEELLTPIVRHRLGDSAGVIGAALLV